MEILWKGIVSRSHPKLCGNCAFPQISTKLGEISIFYEVTLLQKMHEALVKLTMIYSF